MRVLGLDPGTSATGWGLVAFEEGRLSLVRCGVWRPPARLELPARLDFLFRAASETVDAERPDAVSIETVFTARNVASTLKLTHARGVLLLAAARGGAPVHEYAPRLVKKCLTGWGAAEKSQVRAMVLSLLARQRGRVALDAADALALAICHIHAAPPRLSGAVIPARA
ncbi:MAG TPA: crossover junction endodeoxyribonuclease RuvC [Thermoanaerobaculia bacterium]